MSNLWLKRTSTTTTKNRLKMSYVCGDCGLEKEGEPPIEDINRCADCWGDDL